MADRLRHRWLRHLDRVADHGLRTGRPDAAIAGYLRALEVEPATEHLYRRLMEILHRLGRHDEALQVYERCCRTLATLLDAQPSPETRSLRDAVRMTPPRRM
jgi:DNA-binding SARP family transcriptional activator